VSLRRELDRTSGVRRKKDNSARTSPSFTAMPLLLLLLPALLARAVASARAAAGACPGAAVALDDAARVVIRLEFLKKGGHVFFFGQFFFLKIFFLPAVLFETWSDKHPDHCTRNSGRDIRKKERELHVGYPSPVFFPLACTPFSSGFYDGRVGRAGPNVEAGLHSLNLGHPDVLDPW